LSGNAAGGERVSTSRDEHEKLEQAIAALEAQRAILGDGVVNSAQAALRAQRATPPPRPEAPSLEGERKLVSVMFADLSGFTALSEALDPERVRSIVNQCFNLLVAIVEHYGGTVDKFIGDEIMALFGAPQAHENDAERALRAALDMREALAGLNAADGVSLGMHIGINSGTVVTGGLGSDGREQYSVMGDTVNLAARLAEAAPEGEILVGPTTRRLTSLLFHFGALPPMTIKGKAEPVAVSRLEDTRTEAAYTRGVAGLVSPLVGRDADLATLLDAVNDLAAGTGGVVAVTGDPGLGKSRLVAEVRQRTEAGVRWIEGRAQSYTDSMSFWLARSLLSAFIGLGPDAAPADLERALRAQVSTLFPESEKCADVYPYLARLCDLALDTADDERLSRLSPEALRNGMRRAFADLLAALCAQGPLVLVWEDLHWADPSSLELLGSLFALTTRAPLLLLMAFRPQEGNVLAWYERAVAAPTDRDGPVPVRTIELTPLTDDDSRELVENLLRVESLPVVTRRTILTKAEGNPFFLEELLRSLIDSGLLIVEGDHVVATEAVEDLQVPDTVQGVIAARIDRLPSDDKHTLQTAAVIGRVFQEAVLSWLVEREHVCEDLGGRLAELQRRELVRRRTDLELIFKHAITQDVTYHSLLLARRQELHRVTAEAIEALFPDRLAELSGTLAHHYGQAGAPALALRYLTIAAERAAATYSNAEAIGYYRSALEAAEAAGQPAPAKLHESLGDLLTTSGEHAPAREEFREALAVTAPADAVGQARLHRRTAKTFVAERRFAEAVAAFATAERALGDSPGDDAVERWQEWVQIQADLTWLYYWDNRVEQMAELVQAVRPVVERVGTPRQRGAFFNALLLMELRRTRYVVSDEMLGYGHAYVAAQREVGDPTESGMAHFMNGFAHLWHGDLDTAEEEFQTALGAAKRTGDVTTQARCLTYLTVTFRKRGDAEKVRYLAAQSLAAAAAAHMPEYTATAQANLAWAAWHQAQLADCEARAGTALAHWAGLPTGHASAAFQWTALWPLIGVCLAQGRTGDAVAHGAALLAPELMRLPAQIEDSLGSALACWERGDEQQTMALLSGALTQAQRTGWL
jgi:class 3 adenylate cyclase/tetratricopeptide (TPR) repeat protein